MSSVVIYGDKAKLPDIYKTLESIANEINRDGEPISFTVAVAGTEVSISHKLNAVPSSAFQVVAATTTGTGVIYPGTTAWTATTIYLTATVAGVYHFRARR